MAKCGGARSKVTVMLVPSCVTSVYLGYQSATGDTVTTQIHGTGSVAFIVPLLHWSSPFFSAQAEKEKHSTQHRLSGPSVHLSVGLTACGEDLTVVEPLPLLRHRQGNDSDSKLGPEGQVGEGVGLVHLPK